MRFLMVVGCLILAMVLPVAAEVGDELAPQLTWERSVLDAFVKAVDEQRPLVVVFGVNPSFRSPEGRNASNMLLEEFDAPELQALGKHAVYVVCQLDHRTGKFRDEYGGRMWTHLKLDAYPTLCVIAPRSDRLTMVYHMDGYFPAATIAADLRTYLPQALKPSAPASAPATPADAINQLSQAMRAGDALAVANLLTAPYGSLYTDFATAAGRVGTAKRRLLVAMDGQFGAAEDAIPYGADDTELRGDLQKVSAVILEEAAYPELTVAVVRVRITFKAGGAKTTELRVVRENDGWKIQPEQWLGFSDEAHFREHVELLNRLSADYAALAQQVSAGTFPSREACREAAKERYLVAQRQVEVMR